MPTFTELVQDLPLELFDEIKALTFTVDGDDVVELTKGITATQDIAPRRSTDVGCRLQAPGSTPNRPHQPRRLR